MMLCLYLWLFDHLQPAIYGALGYVIIVLGLSMHFNSWTASRVRTTSKRVYKRLFAGGRLCEPYKLSVSAKIHVSIFIYIYLSKSNVVNGED